MDNISLNQPKAQTTVMLGESVRLMLLFTMSFGFGLGMYFLLH